MGPRRMTWASRITRWLLFVPGGFVCGLIASLPFVGILYASGYIGFAGLGTIFFIAGALGSYLCFLAAFLYAAWLISTKSIAEAVIILVAGLFFCVGQIGIGVNYMNVTGAPLCAGVLGLVHLAVFVKNVGEWRRADRKPWHAKGGTA